jgi:hypothetical protein
MSSASRRKPCMPFPRWARTVFPCLNCGSGSPRCVSCPKTLLSNASTVRMPCREPPDRLGDRMAAIRTGAAPEALGGFQKRRVF